MQSMTASAHITHQHSLGHWQWDIRSVNQRYLEFNFRLPDKARHLEMALRQSCKQQLARGKLDIALRLDSQTDSDRLNLNPERLAQLTRAINQVQSALPEATHLNPLELLNWPGIIEGEQQERQDLEQALDQALLDTFAQTLVEFCRARESEGQQIQKLIQQRIEAMREQINLVRPLMSEILQAQSSRMQNRIAEIAQNLDPDRLATEVALLAQKLDIDEELDRLDHHLNEVEKIIQHHGAIGRRLDFLMQELNREANTLGSKSADTRTTQASVEMKVLIEQMREQIQNIE